MPTRPMTAEEHRQGFYLCGCGKFAHIFRANVVARLPKGYSGERCSECNLWMCSVEKLKEGGMMK